MSTPTRPHRGLRFEPLEPRWTMAAQWCALGPLNPASQTCAPAAFTAPAPESTAPDTAAADNTPASPAEIQLVEQSLNQFALNLYQTITAANAAEPADTAISPFSIAAALAMTYAGAKGETASQLAAALHVDLSPSRFHAAMQSILTDLLPADDSKVQLEIANSLWGQVDFPLLASFQELLANRYDAEFNTADFQHAPAQATAKINQWVAEQTHNMIDELFSSLPTSTRLVLANALYFKASWAKAFEAYATERTVFHLASGDTKDVSMMHQGGYFNYAETSEYQIAELPYEGDRYSMVVLLPKLQAANLTADFSAADLQTWLSSLQRADLSVALPKFKLNTSLSLIDTLQSLGITDAFDGSKANFSGIDGQHDLYISQAVHKAVVEVNETGTEAAAATGIGVSIGQAMPLPRTPIAFYADHPFHFLIRDRETNSILFLGQVQEPSPYVGSTAAAIELPQFTGPAKTNPANPYDVNADGDESTLDALLVINYLNDHLSPANTIQQISTSLAAATVFADVDGDGHIAPVDALILINRLNERIYGVPAPTASSVTAPQLDSAEGESDSTTDSKNHETESAVDALFSLEDCSLPKRGTRQ